jgi:NAD(P)-dependent dehydrogenase (short-subunit alcohol dehydrogenase family)
MSSGPFSFASAFDLTGKVALITGAAGGIGGSIATLFAERGARLVLVDRSEAVHAAATSIGEAHLAYVAEISDEARTAEVVADVVARAGGIDILVNNAGIARLARAEVTEAAMWDETIAVNMRGPFLWAREVGKAMLAAGKGGRIVNMASQAAVIALDGHLAYCASKAGLLGLSRVLALEWGPHGITSNAILPTVVETELGRKVWAGEVGEAFKKTIPSRRFAQPEEIALAALYLASGAAGMVNGAELVVDGGYTIA